jgi:amidophosphoribosyltransferase
MNLSGNIPFDTLSEECGVFGIYCADEQRVLDLTHLALYAMQHRGRVGAGMAFSDGNTIRCYKDLGLVADVFTEDMLKRIKPGKIAIGHVRNSSKAVVERVAAQPLVMRYMKGVMALADNGALVNGCELRTELEHDGAMFQAANDAETIAYLIARKRVRSGSIEKAVAEAMDQIQGAYSMAIMSRNKLIAARDPRGMRPLSLGRIGDDCWVVASETCVFDGIGAQFVRDVEPGEVVMIDGDGFHSDRTHCGKEKQALCIYEYVYFARPDSVINGKSVHEVRMEIGRLLAREHPVEADIVCGVPDSGISAAIGYSLESGIPYGTALIKNKYISQAHMGKDDESFRRALKVKLNVLESIIRGKRVILIDDSIIKGMTAKHIIGLLRKAGATEVHLRISSPPVFNTCYFGTTINDRGSLITSSMMVGQICEAVGADSLGFASVDGIHSVGGMEDIGICDACFTGNYPMQVDEQEYFNKYDFKIGEEPNV